MRGLTQCIIYIYTYQNRMKSGATDANNDNTTLIGGQCVQLTSIVRRIRGRVPFLRPHWIIKYIIISEWKRETVGGSGRGTRVVVLPRVACSACVWQVRPGIGDGGGSKRVRSEEEKCIRTTTVRGWYKRVSGEITALDYTALWGWMDVWCRAKLVISLVRAFYKIYFSYFIFFFLFIFHSSRILLLYLLLSCTLLLFLLLLS
jgi:hypothetical protein